MDLNVTPSAPVMEQVKRRPGRPRRAEHYTCVSVTISSELIQQVDDYARRCGLNRSGAVTRLLSAEIDNKNDSSPLEIETAVNSIRELVSPFVSSLEHA